MKISQATQITTIGVKQLLSQLYLDAIKMDT